MSFLPARISFIKVGPTNGHWMFYYFSSNLSFCSDDPRQSLPVCIAAIFPAGIAVHYLSLYEIDSSISVNDTL